MVTICKTSSDNVDFINLVKSLDLYLALKDGEEHSYYVQFNKISDLQHCLVLYLDKEAVGCGAIKHYDKKTMEIKRMYVKPEFRNLGYATKILIELENWAKELGYSSVILETGKRQTEAVNLYQKTYTTIPNYGQYLAVENSICFMKEI